MFKAFLLVLFLPVMVFAKSLNCEVTEFLDGQNHSQIISSNPTSGDSHGGMVNFVGQVFPEVSGMVALVENEGKVFAVLSLYHEKLEANASGQYQMVADGQLAQLQFLIPTPSPQLAGVQIYCQFKQ